MDQENNTNAAANTSQNANENKQGDLMPKINEVLTNAKKQFDEAVKELDDEQKQAAAESFKKKMEEKLKAAYSSNEELLKGAIEAFNKLMSAQPAQSTQQEAPQQQAAAPEGEEDIWRNCKDKWLRGQREKLNAWF